MFVSLPRQRDALSISTLVIASVLMSCGGGGGDNPPLPGETYTRLALANTTGTLIRGVSSGGSFGPSGSSNGLALGDRPDQRDFRAVLDFDLSSFDPNGTVHQSVLRVFALNVSGDPYVGLGNINITIIDAGSTVGGEDIDAAPLFGSGVRVLTSSFQSGWADIDVTTMVLAARLSGEEHATFLMKFDNFTDGDAQLDSVLIAGIEDAERPQLVIRFDGDVL